MNRTAVVLLLLCCLANTEPVGIAFSQERPSPTGSTEKQTSAIVSIPVDDEFYVGKEIVTPAEIPEKVKQVLKDKPPDEQVVYVKAACPVKYGVVVLVIDALREAGFNRIGLVSEKGKSASESPKSGPPKSPADGASAQSEVTPSTTSTGTVLIEVESKAVVRLNFEAMSLSGLQVALERLLNGRSDKTVFIKAPKEMIYCDVVKVIDIAKGAGAQPIGLQVDNLKARKHRVARPQI